MPKFYVESGPVRLIFDASDPQQAAVQAFQWSGHKQAAIQAAGPLEFVQAAEENGWQLHDVIFVNERGFGRYDGEVFETADILIAWDRRPAGAPGKAAGSENRRS